MAIFLAPKDDPIYGVNGLMHGTALDNMGCFIRDPRYPKASARVYGHNGLTVGDWFARTFTAEFHGAHGDPFDGVTGNAETGASSLSYPYQKHYEPHEDVHHGGPSSTSTSFDTGETLALIKSFVTQNDIRVLRPMAEGRGWRYEGLYRVVGMYNFCGGQHTEFHLQRQDGQPSLESLSRPTAEELQLYERIPGHGVEGWETGSAEGIVTPTFKQKD